jgi:hypothetical protein
MTIALIQLAVFALAFSYASFFEWTLHRFLMHRPLVWDYPYRAHALTHHQIFKADETYRIQRREDEKKVTFAWWNAPLLIGLHVPMMFAVQWLVGLPVLFAGLAAMGLYYFLYEYLHWCMHVPRRRWFESTWAFRWINAHHLAHHRRMYTNFNVVLPLADFVMRTRRPLVARKPPQPEIPASV